MSLAYQLDSRDTHTARPAVAELLGRVDALMLASCDVDDDLGSPLSQAIRYHLNTGGGRIRASVALECAAALALDLESTVVAAAVPELLHNASLIHDDMQDGDTERRGCAALWVEFDRDTALCAGDQMLSAAYGALASFPDPGKLAALLKRVHLRVAEVTSGQTRDLKVASLGHCDFATYESIAAAKSGPLLGLGIELVLIAAGYDQQTGIAARAARDFAVAYQIIDDIADQEHDRADGVRPRRLNAINLLRDLGLSNPLAIGRLRAIRALSRARRLSLQLPRGAGQPLRDCTERLQARLEFSL